MIDFISENPNGGIDQKALLSEARENCTTAVVNVLAAGDFIEEGDNPGAFALFFSSPKALEKALETGELSDVVLVVYVFRPKDEDEEDEEDLERPLEE